MMAIRLAFCDVGNVHLYDGNADGTDAIGNGDGGVGVCSRVHHHGIILTVSFLQLVNQNTFVVRLEIGKLMLREPFAEFWQVILKRDTTVDFGLTSA